MMPPRATLLCACAVAVVAVAADLAAAGPGLTSMRGTQLPSELVDLDLFTGGEGGYYCYRLPNLLQMRTPGHLVAIAQAKPVSLWGRRLLCCECDGWAFYSRNAHKADRVCCRCTGAHSACCCAHARVCIHVYMRARARACVRACVWSAQARAGGWEWGLRRSNACLTRTRTRTRTYRGHTQGPGCPDSGQMDAVRTLSCPWVGRPRLATGRAPRALSPFCLSHCLSLSLTHTSRASCVGLLLPVATKVVRTSRDNGRTWSNTTMVRDSCSQQTRPPQKKHLRL